MRINFSKAVSIVCDEPYRLFFPLGILIGFIGAGHWLFYTVGWSSSYSGLFHSLIQTQGYMICFVIGFLMTAMPRLSSTAHASIREVGSAFLLICAIVGFLAVHLWIWAELGFIALLLAFVRFAFVRISRRNPSHVPPVEFVWIPIAILHGLVG